MASLVLCISVLSLFLFLEPLSATSVNDLLSPLLSPVFDDVCKDVECGKGNCKASSKSAFFFECECEAGWKQTTSDNNDHLRFLPCVIPNCTMNYSCTKAPAPVQDKAAKPDESVFEPCHWSHCGSAGSCNKTSKFTYDCLCPTGYYNLLNISTFPCFQSCEIGMDCSSLGISSSNQATSPPADKTKNQASSITRANSCWSIVSIVFFAMILGKDE